ncbi:ABC transporter ATP-binding protein [Sphingobacterium spiritivorum]|uniref:ABC transporter ATP-binding protein n=1 Tax=Sphingobacterium spiritivorum TaxID=258 RepID=UPI003DA4E3D3
MVHHILTAKDLSFRYKNGTALSFPEVEINKGQHTLLLGDSGSGKTTLLQLLGGLSLPSTGSVVLNGQPLYDLKGSALDAFRAQHIGFIFQEAHLLKNLTLLENIKIAQSLAKLPVNEKAILTMLEQLQLSDRTKSYPNQLSRGQLQRAAIARALINTPSLLIADEPTAALDDTNTARVMELLLGIADQYGSTLLIATHDKRIKDRFHHTYNL